MMQIFVSYAREDKDFATRLVDDLSDYDVIIWQDIRNIPHGANWDLEVQKGLDTSDVMLVLLSKASSASQNVADEWSYFIDKNKLILPVLIEPCEVPFRLSRRQRVDLTIDYRLGFQQLIKALGSPVLLDPDSTQRIRAVTSPPPLKSSPAKSVGTSTDTGMKPVARSAQPVDSSGLPQPVRPSVKASGKPIAPEVSTRMLPIIWADDYHWFNGMARGANTGDIMINSREVTLIPHAKPIITIPLHSVVSAKLNRSIDQYIKLTYYGPDGAFRSIVLMGAAKKRRNEVNQEILNLLKLVTRRSLD